LLTPKFKFPPTPHNSTPITRSVIVNFELNRDETITLTPKSVIIPPSSLTSNYTLKIDTHKAGKVEIEGHATPADVISDLNLFFRIIVANSRPLIIISSVVGWIYFVAWSISFYPQVWLNFKRKSVVGLSFDFLSLNIVGHTMYAIFNCSLYFIGYFQTEYFNRFPNGLNPVELNDVFFSIHASVLTLLTIVQCFVYERGSQRVSKYAWSIICIFAIAALVVIILCSIGNLHWLDFLYTCSYIKLGVTLTKYVPQAYLNYKRKVRKIMS
jgi:cystinosin